MSEHQVVAFRAIDKPVSKENLKYMRQQSSRAEVTPWAFDNEYHYGDFRGNTLEMLRLGYDLHLHYANFGVRKLLIRLPFGLPNPSAAQPYFGEDVLQFLKDKEGTGGSLCIEPYYESEDLDELWEVDEIVNRLLPLRAEILAGDLRPLYLAHFIMSMDSNHDPEETREAPVPAGLDKLSDAQCALAELYSLEDSDLKAIAQDCPPLPKRSDTQAQLSDWLKTQAQTTKDDWLTQLLTDSHVEVRVDILTKFQQSQTTPAWPTMVRNKTIAELKATARELQQNKERLAKEKATRARAKKLADQAVDPTRTLHETEQLVAQRTRAAYSQIAQLLADLREALAQTAQAGLADQQARKLKEANPTLRTLVTELKLKGFLKK